MRRNLLDEMKKGSPDYSRTQKRLAIFLIDNWTEIPLLSIEKIAEKSGVSMASIIRFTRKFGCRGFYDFKKQAKSEHLENIVNPVERFFSLPSVARGKKSLIKAARQDVKNINHLLSSISEETFLQLVGMIEKAGRVYTFGIGISAIFSNLMAYTLNQIQKETHSLDEGSTPVEEKIFTIDKNGLLVFSSFFPYSKCTIEFARLGHEQGLPIVVFTDNEYCPLAPYSTLLLKVPRENILFTSSISALSVLLNAIATEIALKKKEDLSLTLKSMDRKLRSFYQ
jgi:DNA-binding MurR/RpiR family transcriptional regulator